MTITKDLLKSLRADLAAALQPLGAKYGITLDAGNATFTSSRFTLKIEGVAKGGKTKEAETYEANMRRLKLPRLGMPFEDAGKTYITRGMARGGSILCERKDNSNLYRFKLDEVIRATGGAQTAPPSAKLSLEDFCRQVNELDQQECARLNAKPGALFGAKHIPLREVMLKHYHAAGMTPQEARKAIKREAEAEGRAEARAS